MERIKSTTPSATAVNEFMQYVHTYFPRTVFGQNVRVGTKIVKKKVASLDYGPEIAYMQ